MMTTKFLALVGAGILLLISALRFMASPGLRARAPRRVDPRAGMPGDGARGLTKAQAEDLLDWLEAHGVRDRHVSYQPGEGFFVD